VPEGVSITGFAPAAARRSMIWRWSGATRVKCLGDFPLRASGAIERAAASVQSISPRIGQNAPRPKFFIAPADLERSLDDQILTPTI
jgi:hypothetical protein